MAKNILTIGFELPSDETTYTSLNAKLSLLDYDISVFDPDIGSFYGYYDEYLGKPSLDDSNSFQLKEHLEHWRREILESIKAGKVVYMMLNDLTEVYVATGSKSHSGTGRNRQTTIHVALQSNYALLPGDIEIISSKGASMKLHGKDNILGSYWAEFESESEYRVLVSGDSLNPLVVTRTGGKIVGAHIRFQNTNGALVLLPYINFHRDEFIFYKDDEEEGYWTDDALRIEKRFISSIVGVDKFIRGQTQNTPAPDWVAHDKFTLPKEDKVKQQLLKLEGRLEKLNKDKERCESSLSEETILKSLLYESGTLLEVAIREALEILGFEAKPFQDDESEFDVVFESAEGRFIGEAEGKDNKPINITKLRQLEMNIHEDFEKNEVTEMAKGALIGNAFRLTNPDERGAFFTEKCLTASERNKTVLIKSTDLFVVAKYLSGKKDKGFAMKCRKAILNTIGVIEFPNPPQIGEKKKEKIKIDETG